MTHELILCISIYFDQQTLVIGARSQLVPWQQLPAVATCKGASFLIMIKEMGVFYVFWRALGKLSCSPAVDVRIHVWGGVDGGKLRRSRTLCRRSSLKCQVCTLSLVSMHHRTFLWCLAFISCCDMIARKPNCLGKSFLRMVVIWYDMIATKPNCLGEFLENNFIGKHAWRHMKNFGIWIF